METSVIPTFLTGLTEEASIIKTEEHYKTLIEFLLSSEMISTYIFLFLSFLVYFLLRRNIRKQELAQLERKDEEDQEVNKMKIKRIILRNGFILFLAIGFFFIWKDEIKTTFFSISFAIMAIVVLFKEILFNILSSFIISISKAYNIGDVIEVKGKIGTVVDRTILNTKIILKKDGLNTGQEYVVPNSYFMTNEIVVLTRLGHYTTQFLDVHVNKREELLVASKLLKMVADEVTLYSRGRGDKLNNWKKQLKKKEGMDIPSHKPFVIIHPVEKPYLTLKFTCDYRSAFLIQQEILDKYLEKIPLALAEYDSKQKKEIKTLLNEIKAEENQDNL